MLQFVWKLLEQGYTTNLNISFSMENEKKESMHELFYANFARQLLEEEGQDVKYESP